MTENQTEDEQLTRADLKTMSLDAIAEAKDAGRLDALLGFQGPDNDLFKRAETEVIGRADIKQLAALGRHDLIEVARATDRINYTQES